MICWFATLVLCCCVVWRLVVWLRGCRFGGLLMCCVVDLLRC